MYANHEINRVGVDMNDLKHLIEDTKKILQVEGADSDPQPWYHVDIFIGSSNYNTIE